MGDEQELFSKITFIKLIQKNYKGDGLELNQGDIALVSNEKCYNMLKDTPEKFEELDIKDISTDTLKYIYDNKNILIEKDDGRLIYESVLYDFLVKSPLKLKGESKIVNLDKEESEKSFTDIEANSKKSRNVFVIHGRNEKARKALFQFLRAIDLAPLEWSQLIAETEKGSPYIGEILDKAFQTAQAVIVLMTGDDLAKLRDIYLIKDEKSEEFTPQARANVLFEAGMAFGRNPDKTIIVELGKTRKYSDIEGRHVIKMDDSPEKRSALVERLKIAGCSVKTEGKDDWYKDGDFEAALPPEPVIEVVKPIESPDMKVEGYKGDEDKTSKNKMVYDGSIYWLKNKSERSSDKDGPFCPTCYDNNNKSIRLQFIRGDEYIDDYWCCNVCKNNYYGK